MSEKQSPSPYFPLHAALFEAGLAIAAFVLGWLFNQAPWESFRPTARPVALGVAAVLPLLALLWACQRLEWKPLQAVWRVLNEVVIPLFRNCKWVEIAAICLLAGVGEELLFRGLLQTALAEWSSDFLPHTRAWAAVGDCGAVFAAAVVFGALHAVNVAYAVLAALIGVYLGWLYYATGNLAVPVVAHGLYDFVALVYILKARKI